MKFEPPLSTDRNPSKAPANIESNACAVTGKISPNSKCRGAVVRGRSGCGAFDPIIRRGPYRNQQKRRPTDHTKALDPDQARKLINAHAFATFINRPLNAQLVVTWPKTPRYTGDNWAKLQTDLLDKTNRFLDRLGIATAHLWVRERSCGLGAHTHVLIHLGTRPKLIMAKLEQFLRDAFSFLTGGVECSGDRFGMLTETRRAGALRYVLKGLDHGAFRYTGQGSDTENIADVLGIQHRGQQGFIGIKRCGVSETIGPKARKTIKWREIKDLASLGRTLNPEKTEANRDGRRLAA